MFSRCEKSIDIYNFLQKMYDYKNKKDLLYLLKASLQVNESQLTEMYLNNLMDCTNGDLRKEKNGVKLARGIYKDAAEGYKQLYLESLEKKQTIKCIVSAVLAGDKNVLKEISETVKPSIKRIIQKKFEDDIDIISDDKDDIINYFEEFCKIYIIDYLVDNVEWIKESGILFEMAEIAFHYEQFDMAAKMYRLYIEDSSYILIKQLANIFINLGYCMYKMGHYKKALKYFEDVRKINHINYSAYEIPIMICDLINDIAQKEIIAEKGIHVFPDSTFFKLKLK